MEGLSLEVLKEHGVAGIIIFCLLLALRWSVGQTDKERDRNEKLQEERVKLAERSLTAHQEGTQAIRALVPIVERVDRRLEDMASAIGRAKVP